MDKGSDFNHNVIRTRHETEIPKTPEEDPYTFQFNLHKNTERRSERGITSVKYHVNAHTQTQDDIPED